MTRPIRFQGAAVTVWSEGGARRGKQNTKKVPGCAACRGFTRNAATATHAVAESKPNQRLMHYTYWGNLRQVSALNLPVYLRVLLGGRFVPEERSRGEIPLFCNSHPPRKGSRGDPQGPRRATMRSLEKNMCPIWRWTSTGRFFTYGDIFKTNFGTS